MYTVTYMYMCVVYVLCELHAHIHVYVIIIHLFEQSLVISRIILFIFDYFNKRLSIKYHTILLY